MNYLLILITLMTSTAFASESLKPLFDLMPQYPKIRCIFEPKQDALPAPKTDSGKSVYKRSVMHFGDWSKERGTVSTVDSSLFHTGVKVNTEEDYKEIMNIDDGFMIDLVRQNKYSLKQFQEKEKENPSTLIYFTRIKLAGKGDIEVKLNRRLSIFSATIGLNQYGGETLFDGKVELNKLYELDSVNFVCESFKSNKSVRNMVKVDNSDRNIIKSIVKSNSYEKANYTSKASSK